MKRPSLLLLLLLAVTVPIGDAAANDPADIGRRLRAEYTMCALYAALFPPEFFAAAHVWFVQRMAAISADYHALFGVSLDELRFAPPPTIPTGRPE